VWGEGIEERADATPGSVEGALGGLAREMFELGEDLLDGIEIGAIGRQEEELGAGGADGAADERALVAAEIYP